MVAGLSMLNVPENEECPQDDENTESDCADMSSSESESSNDESPDQSENDGCTQRRRRCHGDAAVFRAKCFPY